MKNKNLHDWLLLKIEIDWVQSTAIILLKNSNSEIRHIQAEDFYDIHVPKSTEWGESISILEVDLSKNEDKFFLKIQMQSGDNLQIIAKTIKLI